MKPHALGRLPLCLMTVAGNQDPLACLQGSSRPPTRKMENRLCNLHFKWQREAGVVQLRRLVICSFRLPEWTYWRRLALCKGGPCSKRAHLQHVCQQHSSVGR